MANDNKEVKLKSVCSLDIHKVFVDLHENALGKVKEAGVDCIIENTAIIENGNNYKFFGPGQHTIRIFAKSDKEDKIQKISKDSAYKGLQTYIQWFVGPDVSKELSKDDLLEISDHSVSENIVPSFIHFLLKEADADPSSSGSDTPSDPPADPAPSDPEPSPEDPSDKPDTNGKNDEADGYYVGCEIEIEGHKSSTFKDIMGKTFSKLGGKLKKLKKLGLGVQFGRIKGPATKVKVTLGDLAKIASVFTGLAGKIDPNELKRDFDKELHTKFTQTRAEVEIFDKETLRKYIGKRISGKNLNMIMDADLSLCVKVGINDKSRSVIDPGIIAQLLTHSIKGIYKTWKNAVSEKNVILVAYNENDKTKNKQATQLSPNMNEAEVPLDEYFVTEEDAKKKTAEEVFEDAKTYLKQEIAEEFKDGAKSSSAIAKSSSIVHYIQSKAKDPLPAAISEIEKHKVAFMIEVKTKAAETHESFSQVLHADRSLLDLLFESIADDDPNKTKIENIFRDLFVSTSIVADLRKEKPTKNEIYAFKIEPKATTESQLSIMRQYDVLREESSSEPAETHTIYVLPDYADLFEGIDFSGKQNYSTNSNLGMYDLYIVPMKGLKYKKDNDETNSTK